MLANEKVFGQNKTCAIVTGDPCLHQHNFGQFIDSHDVVLRLNMHECHNHEHCGSKTTHMLANDQFCLLSRGRGARLAVLNENITLIYNHFISDWDCMYNKLDGDKQLSCFAWIAKSRLKSYTLDPLFIQSATAAFERVGNSEVLNDMVSTGFLGVYLLTKVCTKISAFGFCAPKRYRWKQFHAFDKEHEIYAMWSNINEIKFSMYL